MYFVTLCNFKTRPSQFQGTRAIGIAWSFLALALATVTALAHSPAEEMAEAANNFLAALTPEQRAEAVYELQDGERLNWHFIPRERKGLPLKAMTPAQQHLAHGLLSSGLSNRGYVKATTIMSLESVLKEIEQGKGPARDPERYFFTIFGQPEAKGTWAWRVEGHHLSLNFTVVDGEVAGATPSFFGTNPGEVREGPRKGLRVLGAEEDLGRQLVKSLSEEQRTVAILQTAAPQDVITSTNRHVQPLVPDGLPASKMTQAQKQNLSLLLSEYVSRHRPELAEMDMRKIQAAGLDKIHFAWAGGLEPGQAHYYRVQGPTFVMEYDNTQNNANHIHTVWRDFDHDFGGDLLRRHYEQTPHSQK